MKPVEFCGDSRDILRSFPQTPRNKLGEQLRIVQDGCDPADWKPMPSVGVGVREIRVRDVSGAYRVIYLAKLADRVVVLHAFVKKTQATAKRDIDLARKRLKDLKP